MRYRRGHRSSDVEYRAPARSGKGLAVGGGGLGVVGLLIVLALNVLGGGGGGSGGFGLDAGLNDLAPASGGEGGAVPPRNDFLEFVFDDVQDTWGEIFAQGPQRYERSRLVIFSQAVQTGGCGTASSAVGPFYCPADSQVYLDQSFFDDLARRFGAPGDFAQAYVVAHEVGHHVQNVLGVSEQVRNLQRQQPDDANELSVLLELQADCFAGVWGFTASERGLLERGDLEEGLEAAAAVGDDRIQEQAGRQVNPESWTHGSSEQRRTWFRRGFDSGDPSRCDTFAG